MKLEDFVKDLALNLTPNNAPMYKEQAVALTIDVDTLDGEALASMIQNINNYDSVLNRIFQGDTKKLQKAVEKIMKETDYTLSIAQQFYLHNKKLFKIFNYKTRQWILNPEHIGILEMTNEVLNAWLDLPDNQMYSNTSTVNYFRYVLDTKDKSIITQVINHKNFNRIASHYAILDLLINNESLLTKQTWDKVLTRICGIINTRSGWNTNFSKELSPIGKSPYLQIKHFELFTDVQSEAIIEIAKLNKSLDVNLLTYLYARTNDTDFLPETVQNIFVF